MNKIKEGDRVIIRRPKHHESWNSKMDYLDGKEVIVGKISPSIHSSVSSFDFDDWCIYLYWCEKVEQAPCEISIQNPTGYEEGVKFDQDKIRTDLLPPDAMLGIAEILTFGAKKYGDRNWERGMKWSRPYGALLRHIWAWWNGEDKDPETGKSHLDHAACCISFLSAYEKRKIGEDDRP
jgi:hypothetical protein